MICKIREEEFQFHASRLLIWPAEKILVVADIHLGKAQTFLKNGLWLPPQAHADDLSELLRVALKYQLDHILFLGDFVHSVEGVTENTIEEFKNFSKEFGGEITVVIGNHDRPLVSKWPDQWSFIKLVEAVQIKDFIFQHEPPTEKTNEFVWCGHIHPKLKLRKGGDQLSLPVFVITPHIGYLPAFSSLAGGAVFKYSKSNRYYVAGEGDVFQVQI